MAVTLTAPAMGQAAGTTYTGPEEAWLLAEGYASQANYTGPGVASTGAATVVPADDLTLAVNREEPGEAYEASGNLVAPQFTSITPATGPAAGGTKVTIAGDHFVDVTSVTIGGVAVTGLEVKSDKEIVATTPAGTAGAKDVIVTDADGATTATGAYTYA